MTANLDIKIHTRIHTQIYTYTYTYIYYVLVSKKFLFVLLKYSGIWTILSVVCRVPNISHNLSQSIYLQNLAEAHLVISLFH